MNMNTSLTTFDGYPRDDIDVAQSELYCPHHPFMSLTRSLVVRTTRARIIRLKNDYKDLMRKIEAELHNHHAGLQAKAAEEASRPPTPAIPISQLPSTEAGIVETPFAKVNTVAPGSPAESAGLKSGDGIRNFGGVNWMNHENLSKVSTVVRNNEGVRGHSSYVKTYRQLIVISAAHHRQNTAKRRSGYSRTGTYSYTSGRMGWSRNLGMPSTTSMKTIMCTGK